MAITCGFFDSKNHDRKYRAWALGHIFDGLISDGVYMGIGNRFSPVANNHDNTVMIGTGRAWLNHTWIENDSPYPINMPESNIMLDRYDAIVIEVNNSPAVRDDRIIYVIGEPSSNPKKPTLTNNFEIHQNPICYIKRKAGSTSISQSDVEYVVGTELPFVTAIVKNISVNELVRQMNSKFDDWFNTIKGKLDGDTAGHLQNSIDGINQKIKDYDSVQLRANNAVQKTDMNKVLYEKSWDPNTGTLDIGVGLVPADLLKELNNV